MFFVGSKKNENKSIAHLEVNRSSSESESKSDFETLDLIDFDEILDLIDLLSSSMIFS